MKKKVRAVLQVAKAVIWAFMGIRKKSDLENDAEMLTPVQVVIGGHYRWCNFCYKCDVIS